MKWGNFKILDIVKAEYLADNKDFKKTVKVNWLADHQIVMLTIFSFKKQNKFTFVLNF